MSYSDPGLNQWPMLNMHCTWDYTQLGRTILFLRMGKIDKWQIYTNIAVSCSATLLWRMVDGGQYIVRYLIDINFGLIHKVEWKALELLQALAGVKISLFTLCIDTPSAGKAFITSLNMPALWRISCWMQSHCVPTNLNAFYVSSTRAWKQ